MDKGIINKLSDEVIHQIAAGEIVQSPYSVIKELVENSIDAKAQNIVIKLKGGGIDLIEIIDDGIGICKEDFPLLCERYATSKIKCVEDLKQLSSFGFRGEALSSVSLVAKIFITSKQRHAPIGYKAIFQNSKIVDNEILPVGCNDGTIIEVQNLFYNLVQRRKSGTKLDDKKQQLRLIQALALHHSNKINFKLFMDNHCEFQSTPGSRLHELSSQWKTQTNQFSSITIESETYDCQIEVAFSILSAIKGKKELFLFINDRFVDSDWIRRYVDRAYQVLHQSIYDEVGGYCVYINLNLNPNNVDPNVHPNKKEVRFINEVEIATLIEEQLHVNLKNHCKVKELSSKQQQTLVEDSKEKSIIKHARQTVKCDPKTQTLNNFFLKNQPSIKKDSDIPQAEVKVQYYPNLKQDLEYLLLKHQNPQSLEFIQNCVFVGTLSPENIIISNKTTLLLLNTVRLLQNFYVVWLIKNLDQSPLLTAEIKLEHLIDFFGISKSAELNEQQTLVIKSFPQLNVGQKLSINELQSVLEQVNQDPVSDQAKYFFNLLNILSELLAFGFESTDQELMDYLQKIGELKCEKGFDKAKFDNFYRDLVLPFLKRSQIILDLNIIQHSKVILTLEDIYHVFERC